METRIRRILGVLVLFILTCGCSPKTLLYPVRGKVLFTDGAPVTFGMVEGYSAELESTTRSAIGPDGSFELTTPGKGAGAQEGTYRIIVVQSTFPLGMTAEHTRHDTPVRKIARRFSRYETTPLRLTVSPAKPSENVVLTVEPGR